MHLLDVPSGRASALAKDPVLVNFSNPSGKLVLAASRLFRTFVDEKACEVGIPFRKVRVDPPSKAENSMKSELKHCGYSRFQKKDTDFAYFFVKETCAKVPLTQV